MARNSEKAMAVLNRWTQVKAQVVKGVRGRRPRETGQSESVDDCEYWRNQTVREVTRKIAEIQNAGLGEHRIRDLNDEINKLLREKGRWEDRIKDLGGPDHRASAPRVLDAYGAPLTGEGSYKYFGAAKDLPGVRELFERDGQAASGPKRTRAQLYKKITPAYYGWMDEDDGDLILAELSREAELQKLEVERWHEEQKAKTAKGGTAMGITAPAMDGENSLESIVGNAFRDAAAPSEDEGVLLASARSGSADVVLAEGYVTVPAEEEIQELLLAKRKQELLEKYDFNFLDSSSDEDDD